jgi:hypothetical protein
MGDVYAGKHPDYTLNTGFGLNAGVHSWMTGVDWTGTIRSPLINSSETVVNELHFFTSESAFLVSSSFPFSSSSSGTRQRQGPLRCLASDPLPPSSQPPPSPLTLPLTSPCSLLAPPTNPRHPLLKRSHTSSPPVPTSLMASAAQSSRMSMDGMARPTPVTGNAWLVS